MPGSQRGGLSGANDLDLGDIGIVKELTGDRRRGGRLSQQIANSAGGQHDTGGMAQVASNSRFRLPVHDGAEEERERDREGDQNETAHEQE